MAIAFDAKSQLTTTNSSADGNWTHTPSGTPAGVIVMIAQGEGTTDQVVGVTYGGTAMTRQRRESQAGGGDPTNAYLYFLGTSVPSGAQTVSVDINSTLNYAATCVTVTADSGATEVDVEFGGNGTANNPTLTLDYTDALADWIALVVMADGAGTVAGANINTGTSLYENDLGQQVGMFSYIEGTGGTSQDFTTSANNASWAWCGVVVKEASSEDPNADPQTATLTAAAQSATSKVNPTSQHSAVTATAENAASAVKSTSQTSVVAAAAHNPGGKSSPVIEHSVVGAAAENAASKIDVNSTEALVGAAALNATVTTGGGTSAQAEAASVTAAANDATISTSKSVPAEAALVGAAAQNTTTKTSPTPAEASVSTVAESGGGSVHTNAGTAPVNVNHKDARPEFAAVGVAALDATVSTGAGEDPNADPQTAVVSASAEQPSISIQPTAQSAGVTAAAENTQSKVSPTPTEAPVGASAENATITTTGAANAPAQTAAVAAAALNPSISVKTSGNTATVTATANGSTVTVRVSPSTATLTAVANNTKTEIDVSAGTSSVTAVGENTKSRVSTTPTDAPVGAAAQQATVITGSFTTAQAQTASVTVVAGNNRATIRTTSECAIATVQSDSQHVSVLVSATAATAFATSTTPTVSRTGEPRAGSADVTVTAQSPSGSVVPTVEAALVSVVAGDCTTKAPIPLPQPTFIVRRRPIQVFTLDSPGGVVVRDNPTTIIVEEQD